MRALLERFSAAAQPGWSVLPVQRPPVGPLPDRWEGTFVLVHKTRMPSGQPCIWIKEAVAWQKEIPSSGHATGEMGLFADERVHVFYGTERSHRVPWWLTPGRWDREWYRQGVAQIEELREHAVGWSHHEELTPMVEEMAKVWRRRVGNSRFALMAEVLKEAKPYWHTATFDNFPAVNLERFDLQAVHAMAITRAWDEGENDLLGWDAKPIMANCRRIAKMGEPSTPAPSLITIRKQGTRRPLREALMRARAIHITFTHVSNRYCQRLILWGACRNPKNRAKIAKQAAGMFGWANAFSSGASAKEGVRIGHQSGQYEYTVTWTELADAALRGHAPAPGQKWRRHWRTGGPATKGAAQNRRGEKPVQEARRRKVPVQAKALSLF